jgi:ABC-2 type transport system ATP-binding protein
MTAIQTAPRSSSSEEASLDGIDIKCQGLTKIFKDFWLRNRVVAVKELDLEVRRGMVFGLLGPNGSGKSTTIKMILGLLHATAGRVAVFGKRPEDVKIKIRIGYLPEESYLYRFLNARETLDYYGRLFHQSRVQRRKRIDMLLEMVGLEAVQRRPVGEYSKGMQRRIGLAQALINDPQLLILDEPTTGLDPIGAQQIKDLILELKQRGKTVLLCSHLLGEVEDVCDRVAIMFGGQIRAQGTCDELLRQEDATLIRTPQLDVQTVQAIEAVLAERGLAIDTVDRPRQRLESLFMQIVREAEAEGAATHGARGDGRIAQFLTDEDGAEAAPEQVIDQLVTSATDDIAPITDDPPPIDTAIEEQLISDLVEDDAPDADADDAPLPETKSHDQGVIDGLTGARPDDSDNN